MRWKWLLGLCLFMAVSAMADEPPKQVTCSGKVVDQNGAAVSGVLVQAFVRTVDENKLVGRSVGDATTKQDGTFTFAQSADYSDWPAWVQFFASKDGFALGFDSTWRLDRDQDVTIKLYKPASMGGIVVDAAGKGVEGAEVRAVLGVPIPDKGIDMYAQIFGLAPFNGLAVRTDAAGQFVFKNIPPTARGELLISAPGKATIVTAEPLRRPATMQFKAGQTDIRVVLPVEARISGVVVEKTTGRPIPKQELDIWFHGPGGSSFARSSCVSAEDGTYSVGGLGSGAYGIWPAAPRNKVVDWVAAPIYVKTQSGETTNDVRIELGLGGMVEVAVTDAVSGRPVENVRFGFSGAGGGQYQNARTDKDGLCRVRLTPGKYRVSGSQRAYKRTTTREANVVEGETARVAFKLAPFPDVKGVVLDPAGKAVPGASVRIATFGRESITDMAGKFEVKTGDMSCNEDYQFHLLVLHRERNLARVMALGDGPQTVEVKLLPGVTVAGRVIDPDGKPVSGAEIKVTWHEVGGGYGEYGKPLIADADGRFEANVLPAGESFYFAATAKGYARANAEATLAEAGGQRAELKDLVIKPAPFSISGIVVDDAGKPVVNLYVNGGGKDQPGRNAKTGADGRFKLDNFCAGKVSLHAYSPDGGENGSTVAEAGAQDVRIVAQQPRYLDVPTVEKKLVILGKPLPALKEFKIAPDPGDLKGKMLLVCFWDKDQRPSRSCVTALAAKSQELSAKGVAVVLLHAASEEAGTPQAWLKAANVSYPVGQAAGNAAETLRAWGVQSLPWLILTDPDHVVRSAGFGPDELGAQLESLNKR